MTPRASIVAIMIILLISVSFLSFRAGLLQGYADAAYSDAQVTTITTTVSSIHVIYTTSIVSASPIVNPPFAVFIDNIPQLRISWGTIPFTVHHWVLYDGWGAKLIEFDDLTGAYTMNDPYLDGLPIGFKALAHPVDIGDTVRIYAEGSVGGATVHTNWTGQITTCNSTLTWC